MRLLWFSNTPLAATGYGVETAEIVPRIKAAGHDIAIAVNWGHYSTTLEWKGIPLFPAGKDKYSNDIVNAHAQAWNADWTFTLYDAWPLHRPSFPERVASWVPVDHQPVPHAVAEWCRTVRPIAMSQFGQRMLAEQDIESAYIPHSINTKVFKPTELLRGFRPRDGMNIPDDAFVVMIAAANQGVHPPRKAWGQMFLGLSAFMRDHPDVYAYIHTDRIGIGGVDLNVLAKATTLPLERVRWAEPYSYAAGRISQEDLAAVYSMADVLLAPSMGEGFGIPVIEAQACGLPVIVSDFSAQPELCESGWLVRGQYWWDEAQAAWFYDPFIHSILKNLEVAYAARGDNGLRQRAIAFAAEYDTDKVFDRYWVPFLATLEQPVPVNRSERRRQRKARKAA